jgi:hypothetical protein
MVPTIFPPSERLTSLTYLFPYMLLVSKHSFMWQGRCPFFYYLPTLYLPYLPVPLILTLGFNSFTLGHLHCGQADSHNSNATRSPDV